MLSAHLLLLDRVVLRADLVQVHRRLRVAQAHPLHRLDKDLRHSQVPEPLLVARDQEPGRARGGGALKRLVERRQVGVEAGALLGR